MLAENAVEAARRFGDRPAFITDEGLTLTYAEFNRLADEAAVGLAAHGVTEGDVVALVLPSVPEHFIAYLAAAKLGALTAAVNPKLVLAERAAVLRAAQPKVVISTADLAPTEGLERGLIIEIAPAVSVAPAIDSLRSAPCVAGTTCIRWRWRRCWLTIPMWRPSPSWVAPMR